ncbi:MAG: TonB-dependent receptor [Opitutaceae bacterium]
MKTVTYHTLRLIIASAGCIGGVLCAQSTNPSSPGNPGDLVVLDPFTVAQGADKGYAATATAAGLGFAVQLEKLPIPINILTPQFLQDIGSFKVEDAIRYTSGVAVGGRNAGTEGFVIRGFSTGNMLRDGQLFNVPTDMSIIDSVEIIKGPAAIIYGVTDPAGLINIVTKKPSFKPRTDISGYWDEYGTVRGTIDYNTPLAKTGQLRGAARFIVTRSYEGYPRPNEFRDRTLFAPSLHLEYGKNTSFDASYHHTDEDGRLNRIQTPWDRIPGDTVVENGVTYAGIFAKGIVPVARDFTYVTPNDDWQLRSHGFDLRLVQHVTDDIAIQLAYADTDIDRLQYFNLGGGRITPNSAGQYLAGNFQMIVETNEVNHRGISGKVLYNFDLGATKHKLTVGYRDSKDRNFGSAFFDKTLRTDITPVVIADANGGKPGVKFKGAPQSVFKITEANAMAISGVVSNTDPNPVVVRNAYVSDFISMFDDRLNVLLGASYVEIATQNESSTIPQFGATYAVLPGWNLYGLYSKSFKANGPLNSLDPSFGFFRPEKGEGREIGLKLNPNAGKWSGSLAFFDIKRRNLVKFVGGGQFDINNYISSGEETSKGVEFDLVYAPTPELSVIFGYAYTDAYTSKDTIVGPLDDQNKDGIADSIGLTRAGVAKNDLRLWLSYGFANTTGLKGLTVGGGITWRQGPIQQFQAFNQRLVRENNDPTRLDLFAAYNTKLGRYDLRIQANMQNATNALYVDRLGYFVQPSTFTLSVDLRF